MSIRHQIIYSVMITGLMSWFPGISQLAPDTIHIPEVEIFSHDNNDKQAYSFSEVDSNILSQDINSTLSDILIGHSSIYIKSTGRGTLSTASFRGTDASHTKICWNGLIINSAMLGQTDLSLIPALFIDNISLYHGGSSLNACPGALGGVIALENNPVWNEKSSLSVINEIASFGTYHISGKLELKKNKWISESRAYYLRSDNDYPFYNSSIYPPQKQRLQNSQYSGYGYLHELYFRTPKDDLFSARLWLQHTDRNLPESISREGSDVSEDQADGNIRSVFSWDHYGKTGEFKISSGIMSDNIRYTLSQSADGNLNIDSRSRENSFINQLEYSLRFNSKTVSRVQVLYNYYNAEITERIRSEGYKADRSELSLMAGLNREFGRRIYTFILLRSGLVDKDFIPLMPSAGFSLKLLNKKELYFKTNLSRNYNVPRLNDLYWIPGGNPGLKPEESYTADIALDFKVHNDFFTISSGITGYVSRISNWILWRPTQYQYWAPENVAIVHSRGLEFSIKTSAEIDLVKIMFQANYNLCKSTDSGGRQLIYVPVHNLNGLIGITFKGYSMVCQAGYTGKRYTQTNTIEETSETVLKPYLITDVSLGKELSLQKLNLNFKFSVINLFNEVYQVVLARPMPGRNYSLIIGFSF